MLKALLILVSLFGFISACMMVTASKTEGTEVRMDRKGLTAIPFEYYSDTMITGLSFFANKIDFIDEEIEQMQNLEVLILGKNKFKKFPEAICRLKKLRILSLAYNQIDSIPDCIGRMKSLERIYLNNNKLVYISDSLAELTHLEQLYLARNSIRQLPERLTDVRSMYLMDLSYNNLHKLPDSMQFWRELRELNLQHAGPMLHVPESACGLRFLEKIKADPGIVFPNCFMTQQTNRLVIYIEP